MFMAAAADSTRASFSLPGNRRMLSITMLTSPATAFANRFVMVSQWRS
jgi:hypothetical protein